MSRHFTAASADRIDFALGSLSASDGGPLTAAILWRLTTTHNGTGVEINNASLGECVASFRPEVSGGLYYAYGGNWLFGNFGTYAASAWRIDVCTKDSGSATPRGHHCVQSGSWTHGNGDTARDDAAFVGTRMSIGGGAHGALNGDVAAVMLLGRVISDAEAETLWDGLSAWNDLISTTSAGLWALNQSSVGDEVLDLTGGGADQTAISGTSIGDDPSGWSYDLAESTSASGASTLAALTTAAAVSSTLPTAQLVDGFASGFSPHWNANYGSVSVVNGRGRVQCAQIGGVPQWSGIMSTLPYGGSTWTFVDAALAVEVPTIPVGASGTVYAGAAVQSETPGTRVITVYNAPSDTISFQSQVGWGDADQVTIAYSATDHRWWRVRHSTSADAVYWDTSPDGITWTTRRTLSPAPDWIASDDASVVLDAARDNGTDDYAEFDNVNLYAAGVSGGAELPALTGAASVTVSPNLAAGSSVLPALATAVSVFVDNSAFATVTSTLPALTAAAAADVDNPVTDLWPDAEIIAKAWLSSVASLSTSLVGMELPTDVSTWTEYGYLTIGNGLAGAAAVTGGQIDKDTQLHSPVLTLHAWAVNPYSGKPPWNKAKQLLQHVWRACCDESTIRRTLTLPTGYRQSRVNEAYLISDIRRVPGDEGSYAHFQADLQLHWVVL